MFSRLWINVLKLRLIRPRLSRVLFGAQEMQYMQFSIGKLIQRRRD